MGINTVILYAGTHRPYGFWLADMLRRRINRYSLKRFNMATTTFYCKCLECHGNKGGGCRVLTTPIKGKSCPFYKSKLRLQLEREALYEKDMVAYRKAALVDERGGKNA